MPLLHHISNNSNQQLLFAAQHLADDEEDPALYLLFQCIRSYVELDMYAALEVHTTETLAAGRAELETFSASIRVLVTDSTFKPTPTNSL